MEEGNAVLFAPSDKDTVPSPDIQALASTNPFDSMKSEDEEEEGLAVMDSQEEEEDNEEVDEAELEAFLDGQLADRPSFLHDGSDLTADNQELSASFVAPPSKSEEALRTCTFRSGRSECRLEILKSL